MPKELPSDYNMRKAKEKIKSIYEEALCSTCKTNTLDKCEKVEVVNDLEFDKVKEDYCPRCYFDDDKKILRKDCPCHKVKPEGVGEWESDFEKEFPNFIVRLDYFEQTKMRDFCKGAIKSFISALLLQEKAKWKAEIENTRIDKAHTYASENAENYRIYDAGQENYKKKVLSLIDKL